MAIQQTRAWQWPRGCIATHLQHFQLADQYMKGVGLEGLVCKVGNN